MSNEIDSKSIADHSGQTLAGAGGELDLGQFREAVNCLRAVITTAAVNLPFNLAAYRASCGVSVPDRLLALIDSQATTSAGTTGDSEDAARYRWLRDEVGDNGSKDIPRDVLILGLWMESGQEMDEMIDDARRALGESA